MIRFLTILTSILLCTCSFLPEQVPVDLYQLPPPSLGPAAGGPQSLTLRIDRPITSEALGGNRLLILTSDNQYQAFPDMRLATPVPLLWRDWLLDAFWRDGRVASTSAASEGLQADLELGGMLRSFHVENNGGPAEAVIQYDATLIRTIDRSIIASRRFESRQPLPVVDVPSAVDALGSAANNLARELIDWSIEQGR